MVQDFRPLSVRLAKPIKIMKKIALYFFPFILISGLFGACSSDEEIPKVIGHEHPNPTEGQDAYVKKRNENLEGPFVVIYNGERNIEMWFYDLWFKGHPKRIKTIRNLSKTKDGLDSLNVIFEPDYSDCYETTLDEPYYYTWFILGSDSISLGDKMYLRCSNNGYSYDGLVSLKGNGDGYVEIEMHSGQDDAECRESR